MMIMLDAHGRAALLNGEGMSKISALTRHGNVRVRVRALQAQANLLGSSHRAACRHITSLIVRLFWRQ
jgi:hypothetical protein